MRFKRVLFIYPDYPDNHYGGKSSHPPVGIGYIAEYLKRTDVDTATIDLGLQLPSSIFYKRLDEFKPDLIAISLMTFRYKHHYALIKNIESYADIPIAAGGPHLTAWKLNVLEQCKEIDFGVSLEGEHTMAALCSDEALTQIKGLIYRDGGDVRFNGERDLIEDLDTLPFPEYEGIDMSSYSDTMCISSSRGCPYGCIFCQSKSILGRHFRARSAGNLLNEIVFWYEKGIRNFSFIDDNFTMDSKRVVELCELIRMNNLKHLDLSATGVRADRVDEDLLRNMKDAGFTHLSFGVESASDNILKILKKNESVKEIERSVSLANKLGFFVRLYFVVGSPYETIEDVKKSIEFAEKYGTGGCNFGSLMPLPDTKLMEWVKENGNLLMDPEYYLNEFAEFERIPYYNGPGMTLDEKRTALEITEKVRIKLENRYQRNLKIQIIKKHFKSDLKKSGIIKASIIALLRISLLNNHIHDFYNKSDLLKRYARTFAHE
ncbi:MAG: radical SAM protein [Proteobacteria bacterium]|nr:radical SAM protein [Pseudomonadota bacterium]